MKLLFTAILVLCPLHLLHAECDRESFIGSDPVSPVCFGLFRMHAGHAIGGRWSADADICLNLKGFVRKKSKMTMEHWKDLYEHESEEAKMREDFAVCDISFCFWPKTPYDGIAFSIGGSIADRSLPDLTAGIGYYCRIWKGLRAGIGYRLRLNRCFRKREFPADGIKISVGYVF